jgi:hypothetical protein
MYSSSPRVSIGMMMFYGVKRMTVGAVIAYAGIYVAALAVAFGFLFAFRLIKLI